MSIPRIKGLSVMKRMVHLFLQCIAFSAPLLFLVVGYYSYQQWIHHHDSLATSIDVMGKTHFIVGHTQPSTQVTDPIKSTYPLEDEFSYLQRPDGSIKYALFAPDDDIQKLLLALIGQEKKSIKIAIFSFTDGKIAQSLLDAAHRNVAVEVVTDDSCLADRFTKITALQEQGIQVHIYASENKSLFADIMHNKFILFDQNIGNRSLLWTGSFNFTQSACKRNQENVVILDDASLIDRYNKQFTILKERITSVARRIKLAKAECKMRGSATVVI